MSFWTLKQNKHCCSSLNQFWELSSLKNLLDQSLSQEVGLASLLEQLHDTWHYVLHQWKASFS